MVPPMGFPNEWGLKSKLRNEAGEQEGHPRQREQHRQKPGVGGSVEDLCIGRQ